jgi:hypothetical protein
MWSKMLWNTTCSAKSASVIFMVKVRLTLSHLSIARYGKFRQTFLGVFSTTDADAPN